MYLLILNRNRDRSDHSGRKLQLLLLDERAARVEHPHDEGPWGFVRVSDLIGVSDGVDVDEGTFSRRDPDGTEPHLVFGVLNRERALTEQEQRN